MLAALAIAAVTAIICLPGIMRFHGVSLYDEMTHADYAYKIAYESRIPRAVEPLADPILEEWACRPTEWNPDDTLCDMVRAGDAELTRFPAEGVNYNGFHPQVYYALTGWGAKLLGAAASPLTEISVFVAMRVMSAVWLAAGLVAFYAVLRMWVKNRGVSFGVTVMMAATPAIASFGMQVNPDSMAVLAGTAGLFLARQIFHGRRTVLLTAILAFLAASTKLLAVVAIVAVVTLALLRGLVRIKKDDREQSLALTAPFVGALVGTGAAFGISETLTYLAGPATQDNPLIGLTTVKLTGPFTRPLIDTLAINTDLVSMYWLPDELDSLWWQTIARVTGIVLIAAVGILLASHAAHDPRFNLALSTLAGALTVPLVIQIRQLIVNDDYFAGVAARYAITIVPLAFACLGLVLAQRRWGTATALTAAGITALVAAASTTGVLTL